MEITEKDKQRFLSKLKHCDNGCIEYTGAKFSQGYGAFYLKNKNLKAHRFYYEAFVGKITDGMQVNHHCDNKICCNVEHLYVGTQKQNIDDREKRNRGIRISGEKHHKTIVSEKDIQFIRKLYELKIFTQKVIGSFFNMDQRSISQIVNHKRWKHI